MLSMNVNPPPVALSDEALKLCTTILALAADPKGTKTRLTELNNATQELRDAIAQHDAAAAKVAEVEARETAVAAREADLQSREDSLLRTNTQLSVASTRVLRARTP
jgi:septal ring factor EnvC (AmiA/AmiB activator)